MKNLVFLAFMITTSATAQQVWLSVSNDGYMTLNWTVAHPGSRDFVALYNGDPKQKGTNGYLFNQWQWASKTSPFITGTREGFFYYVAYIKVDKNKNRKIISIAGPENCLGNGSISGDEYVNILNQCLIKRYGAKFSKSAFALTNDNTLSGSWIAQTPNVWGKDSSEVKVNAGIYIAKDIKTLISGAEHFVDITTLSPFPDDSFHTAILEGLTNVAKSGREVTVRILAGWPETSTFEGVNSYLNSFANPISKIENNKLKIYVAAQRNSLINWNHSKIVAVDGKAVLIGGENLWTNDYLEATPVHDLNLLIRGSAAYYCQQFASLLWQDVCNYSDIWMPWSWESGQKIDQRNCLDATNFDKPTGDGRVSVLGVGRYGKLKDNTNANIQPSDYLMALTLNSSKRSIRIAQQDLAFIGGLYWDEGMKAIANAITNDVDVYIVLSDDGSRVGFNPYSTVSLKKTADKLRTYVEAQSNKKGNELNNLLCKKLHLATLRFGPSDEWPNGITFANHSKFFMVDDKVFYVGSSNLYPSDLTEYGVFISDPTAISQMKSEYWDQLWKYSSRVAISGSEVQDCYFKE
jgi:phosphatidylserine/phosphatidylglycerophosphate/cardiolipin synthase-like enzyme